MPQDPGAPIGVFQPSQASATGWLNPAHVIPNDDQRAQYDRTLGTDWLTTWGYAFPAHPVVSGISVTVQGRLQSPISGTAFIEMQLCLDNGQGQPVPAGRILRRRIAHTVVEDALEVLDPPVPGGPGNLWGLDGLDPREIAKAGFGVRIRCSPLDDPSTFGVIREIDTIRMGLVLGPAYQGGEASIGGSWPPRGLPSESPFSRGNEDYLVPLDPDRGTALVPREWERGEDRHELGRYVAQAAKRAWQSTDAEFSLYQRASRIYDDEETPCSLEILEHFKPYNVPLLQQRVDQVVQHVAAAFDVTEPMFRVQGDGPDRDRDAVESDLHVALRDAGIRLVCRQTGYGAALFGRGPFRCNVQDGSIRLEAIRAEDFVVYPTSVSTVEEARLVGHRFSMLRGDILAKQRMGEWLGDPADISSGPGAFATGSSQAAQTVDDEDRAVDLTDAIVRYSAPDGETRVYRCVVDLESEHLLLVDRYPFSRAWYFAPAFRVDIGRFWPRHSLGTRLIEVQTLSNDAYTTWVLGMASNSFPTVLGSNFTAETQRMRLGPGSILGFRGNPSFTVLPASFRGEAAIGLVQAMERAADGISRVSQLLAGQQLRGDATATEVSALSQGATSGIQEYRSTFLGEWEKAAKFSLELLGQRPTNPGVRRRAAYRRPWRVAVNTGSPEATPQALAAQVGTLVQTAQALNIPVEPGNRKLRGDALVEAVANSLRFASSDELLTPGPTETAEAPDDGALPTLDPALLASLVGGILPLP